MFSFHKMRKRTRSVPFPASSFLRQDGTASSIRAPSSNWLHTADRRGVSPSQVQSDPIRSTSLTPSSTAYFRGTSIISLIRSYEPICTFPSLSAADRRGYPPIPSNCSLPPRTLHQFTLFSFSFIWTSVVQTLRINLGPTVSSGGEQLVALLVSTRYI